MQGKVLAAYIEEKHKSGATLQQLRVEILQLQELIRLVAYDRAELTSRQLAGDILKRYSNVTADIESMLDYVEDGKTYSTNFVRNGETYEIQYQ